MYFSVLCKRKRWTQNTYNRSQRAGAENAYCSFNYVTSRIYKCGCNILFILCSGCSVFKICISITVIFCLYQPFAEVGALRRKGPGERSRSCGDVREDGFRKVRGERRTATQHVRQESKPSGATSSDDLHSSKDSVVTRPTGKQKHVDFVTQQHSQTHHK